MSYPNLPTLFDVRCGKVDPDAHLFLVPDGPRTHENMDAFNKKCELWMKDITKNDPYPDNIKKIHMEYKRDDYVGRAIVYRPNTDELLPMCIFTHGGSYLFWTPEYYDYFCANIAEKGNCVVVNMDFRQNIDVLIPDMFEDAYAWILEAVNQADNFDADASRLVLMGDSSGGTMAAGLSLMCKDRGGPNISHRILIAGGIGFDPEDLDNGNVNAAKTELMGAQNVVKRGFKNIEQSQVKYYSPINDPNMETCPPTTFIVGTGDYMWREVSIYAQKLLKADVKVNIALYQGMPHGFYNGGHGEASEDVWAYIGETIKKSLG
jgi:acetyl esterase